MRTAPRPALLLPVQPWAWAYGLTRDPGNPPQTISLIGPGPGFDPRHAMTSDPDDLVIIATVTTTAGEPAGPLLIDGYARPVTVHNEAAGVADGGGGTDMLRAENRLWATPDRLRGCG